MTGLIDVKTIGDEEEVEYFSEDSDVEIEFQPSKKKNNKVDFNTDFTFASTTEEYNHDVWNDLAKYVKRKAKSKTDDKINKLRKEKAVDEVKDESVQDDALSDDELIHDNIKIKEKKKKKKVSKEQQEFFEEGEIMREDIGSFYEMNLSRPLMKAIGEMKFIHPTPIQASAIPIALLGRDICGCAATGTGKTAAYMLPTLERLLFRPADTPVTRVLVLVPTRELGVQVYQVSRQLSQFTNIEIGLAVGGLDLKAQENILRKNPDIVIATPGRLIDHLKSTPSFSLDSIEVLILDEADRMLDEYFAEQMNEIIKQCSRTRQTMLFSATMTEEVNDLAAVSLQKPVKLFANSNREVAFNLRQEFVRIRADRENDREAILSALICRTFRTHCIIFVQTKKQAHRLHILLGLQGVRVVELHGNLTQPQRLEALAKFKKEQADVMVATDVAARGLDIAGVRTVVNFVMPASIEHYIHRVGRTARAGRAGVSVSLAGEGERKIVKEIVRKASQPVKSRVIPPEILEKYKTKLESLEGEILTILQEEDGERQLAMAENQAKRAQKMLDGQKDIHRPWFQTRKQRTEEKERLSLAPDGKPAKTKTKRGTRGGRKDKDDDDIDTPVKNKHKRGKNKANPIRDELEKVALVQARLAKKKHKVKKLNAISNGVEATAAKAKKGGKKRSHFDSELTDTSNKNAKKLRYNAHQAMKSGKGRVNKKAGKKPQKQHGRRK